MATVNYSIKTQRNPASIYCRFLHTRAIQIDIPINILVDPKHWDKKNQKIKRAYGEGHQEINAGLDLLKGFILRNFNLSYSFGDVIDKNWLSEVVFKYFNRPTGSDGTGNLAHAVYYTDFADWWMDNKAKKWLVGSHRTMTLREQLKYKSFIKLVKEFEKKNKIRLKDVTTDAITEFVVFLSSNKYASNTIQRHVSRFKFFCNRAEEEGLNVNKSFKGRVYTPKTKDIKEPYLDPDEIETIYNHHFEDKSLDNARDNLIIACWTGLRVSDFLSNLNIDNFIDDFIEIRTKKTQTKVVIPIHPMVKKILIKHRGRLPLRVTERTFNKQVKTVCRLCKVNVLMEGMLFDKKRKRKVFGKYRKWELVSSHIGRRSFATNHYGKISNSVIMGVCGWSKEDMMLRYIKKTNMEHAVELKQYWDEVYA